MLTKCFDCNAWIEEDDIHVVYSGDTVWSYECTCGSTNLVEYTDYKEYLAWMSRYHPDWEVLPEEEEQC